jgi:hypothetical protein
LKPLSTPEKVKRLYNTFYNGLGYFTEDVDLADQGAENTIE